MTTGSWSNERVEIVNTDCGVTSRTRVGSTVSWNGEDNPSQESLPPETRKRIRELHFVRNPDHVPYSGGRFKVKLDPTRVAERGLRYSSIFDVARHRRMTIAEGPPSESLFGQPHPFSKNWTATNWPVFTFYDQNGTHSGTVESCGFGPHSLGDPYGSDDDYKLLSRLRSKLTGNSFNLASFLGAEGKDTIRFIGDVANRVGRSLHAVRRGDVRAAIQAIRAWGRLQTTTFRSTSREARQVDVYRDLIESLTGRERGQPWAKVPPKLWLEYQLALEPLLGDVYAGAEQLAFLLHSKHTTTIRASRSREAWADYSLGNGYSKWAIHRQVVRKSIVGYFSTSPDNFEFMGFNSPESVIWNALPLTFVSDYFVDIGSYLEARATRAALLGGVFVTTVVRRFEARNLVGYGIGPAIQASVEPSHGRGMFRSVGSIQRTVSNDLIVPLPSVRPLGAFSNWKRMLTTLSVASLVGSKAVTRYS